MQNFPLPLNKTINDFHHDSIWLASTIFTMGNNSSLDLKILSWVALALTEAKHYKNYTCIHQDELAKVLNSWEKDIVKNDFINEFCQLEPQIITKDPSVKAPFFFNENLKLLYFRRHYKQEVLIAEYFNKKMAIPALENNHQITNSPDKKHDLSTEQKNAVKVCSENYLAIISGGPGTGKTTLLIESLIKLLLEDPTLQIAMVAPTGKAASRINESINKQKINYILPPAVEEAINNIKASTIHRLLGYIYESQETSFNLQKQLSCDILIIDEASMIGQDLMVSILLALPEKSRLIFLGDQNQISSVEPGQIFATLCSSLNNQFVTKLTQSYRFPSDKFIGKLSKAINDINIEEAINILQKETTNKETVSNNPLSNKELAVLIKNNIYNELLEEVLKSEINQVAILNKLDQARILVQTRFGQFGIHNINQIASQIFRSYDVPKFGQYFHGQAIIITQNDYSMNLYNGDVGIILYNKNTKEFQACFRCDNDEGFIAISLLLLPQHETSFAMSIHKSQGSEFEKLLIIIPPTPKEKSTLTRELIYTAITRYKETPESHFYFFYDVDNFKQGCLNKQIIPSGLGEILN